MLFHYVDLVFYKTYADLRAEGQRTYLGFLWWIFEPLMFMSVFYVVFGILLKSSPPDFVAFLLIGLVTWQWMAACVVHGGSTILGNVFLMQQVHLPKLIFPLVLILTDSTKFVFVFALLLLYLWVDGHTPSSVYLALPLVLFVELLLIVAISLFMAAVVPFLPDIRFVVENLLQAVFIISGIFFKASDLVPPEYQSYFYLNPMANLIEDYRRILLYGQWPDWSALAIIGSISSVGIVLVILFIRRFEYAYPKITD
jgi:lipopolysaccharide transport system permease protein